MRNTGTFIAVMVATAAVAIHAQTPAAQPRPATTPAQQNPQTPAQPRPAAPGTVAPAAARPATPPAQGQKPVSPTTPPVAAPGTPAAPPAVAPVPRRVVAQPAPSARGGLTITVTDPIGATLRGVHVAVSGATERTADTNESGQLNLPGLLGGNYRLRFSGDTVITYEREVTLRPGQILDVDVALFPAPRPVAPPPPPPPPAPVVTQAKPATGPTGQPQSVSIPDLLERDFIQRQPRRESVLSCSGSTRATMLQINEPLPERLYADADVAYFVLAGEGTLKLNGRSSAFKTSAFLSVPQGMAHSFERRGNRPLVLLVVLGGEACEQAK